MLMVLLAFAMIPGTWSRSQENELDDGDWNYREGGKSQRVGGLEISGKNNSQVVVLENINIFNTVTFAL